MSGNQNGGGGGCIVLSIGGERHTHTLATKTENVLGPIRLAFELPAVRHEHHTNGGGGGCIRVRIGKVEHEIACKPSDEIELQFVFESS